MFLFIHIVIYRCAPFGDWLILIRCCIILGEVTDTSQTAGCDQWRMLECLDGFWAVETHALALCSSPRWGGQGWGQNASVNVLCQNALPLYVRRFIWYVYHVFIFVDIHWPQWWATLCRSPTEVAHGRHDDHGPFFPLASLSSHAEMLQRRWHAQRFLFWMYIIVYDFVRWGCYANDSWLHMQRQPKNCCCYVEDFWTICCTRLGDWGEPLIQTSCLLRGQKWLAWVDWDACHDFVNSCCFLGLSRPNTFSYWFSRSVFWSQKNIFDIFSICQTSHLEVYGKTWTFDGNCDSHLNRAESSTLRHNQIQSGGRKIASPHKWNINM